MRPQLAAAARRPAGLACCLVLGAAVSLALGQDANWDLLNYHLANGAALLRGRFAQDLMPAGMQSYYNPVLDAAYAGLALGPWRNHPRWLAAAMGLPFGAGMYVAARMALLLHPGRPASAAAAGVLAVTGVAMVSQVGATTGEVPAGALMLAGLCVLLRRPGALWRCAGAGTLFGLAAGLKLTSVAYAPAGCVAVAVLYWPGRRLFAACALFSAGWLGGLAVADGWWALMLYQRFGNPVFPLFNGVFRSPWYPPAGVIDDRFLPHGLLQWLFYPVEWAAGVAFPGELPFRDWRGGAILVLGVAAGVWRRADRPTLQPAQRAAVAFLVVGYVAWLATSSILRYAVVLECVAGLLIPLLRGRRLRGRVLLAGMVATAALLLATTRYPASLRIPYGALWADGGWVEPGTMIVLTFRGPSNYVVALLPHQNSISVVDVGNTVLEARGWRLHDEVVRRIRDHSGRIVVLTEGHPGGRFPELGEVGLNPELVNCRAVGTVFAPESETGLHACDGRRMDPPRWTSPFWAQAALRYRTLVVPPDPAQTLVGAAYLRAAGPAARGTRFIDWTDLLWSGVRKPVDPLPAHPDPGTLYVLPPEYAFAMAARLDPAADAFGLVDGVVVAAPGWLRCAACTDRLDPVPADDLAPVLATGATRQLGPAARASRWLGSGWWPQEEDSVWSGTDAELVIPLAADLPEQATLELTGVVLTGPGLPAQRVAAEVLGHPDAAVERRIAGQGVLPVPLRRAWLTTNPGGTFLLRLHLRLPDATSPAALGLSADPRKLGFSPGSVALVGGP